MNPIHTQDSKRTDPSNLDPLGESLAETLANKRRRHASANRRTAAGLANILYPVMLILSTLVAAVFCLLYISKPVIATLQEDGGIRFADHEAAGAAIPRATDAPAEVETHPSDPSTAAHDDHEETNLRVQHVLNASTTEGDLSRILLDVPVIYASRQLRWTESEVAHAREIHARLADYHEQSRLLRDLGTGILADWNALIERSIPAADLRADSPSLPPNQKDAASLTHPATLDSTEVIEIHPSDHE